ncbi:CE1759 family FMN reductase [Flaviflexus equikiangi]|uniref:NAD(P)H-dependent oxidoreductase n=1 Tax=Flaviflexus equikiangi TaxID=2758573 RepID=A0ABS2TCK2_9ACTO|nr:CE1759 family FMN reductase [Flaviflexus equikiangi]MBM9432380.1 NAD(P)H-dependent oxidoreductase [Flaviflexus equikiangi]
MTLERNDPRRLTVVSGGLGDPSQSRMLADRLAEATSEALAQYGIASHVHVIELRLLATAISDSLIAHTITPGLQDALDHVMGADGVIAVSPTFKASYSGLFKSFWDLVDEEEFAGTPVLLGATGGTARHSLVIDQAMRPLFAYLKALTSPVSVYAAADDWGDVYGSSDSTKTAPIHERIHHAGATFANLINAIPSRPRASKDHPTEIEVTPFEQLLNG